MENNNQTTTEKLHNALNKLLDAYEKLQQENSDLKQKIDILEDSKSKLENNLNDLNDNSGKQNGEIDSMLGKIESILSNNNSPIAQQPTISFGETEEPIPLEATEEETQATNVADISLASSNKDSDNKTNELDLDRMDKLLGGFS